MKISRSLEIHGYGCDDDETTTTILAGDDCKGGIAKIADDHYKRRDIYFCPAT